MAIKLIFAIIVIKKSEIISRFPGGWEKWLQFNSDDKFGPHWFDENLYARCSMDPSAIEKIAKKWQSAGFVGLDETSGEKVWVDFCVPEGNERCDWIDYLEPPAPASVFLAGTEPGEVCYPKGMDPKSRAQHQPR